MALAAFSRSSALRALLRSRASRSWTSLAILSDAMASTLLLRSSLRSCCLSLTPRSRPVLAEALEAGAREAVAVEAAVESEAMGAATTTGAGAGAVTVTVAGAGAGAASLLPPLGATPSSRFCRRRAAAASSPSLWKRRTCARRAAGAGGVALRRRTVALCRATVPATSALWSAAGGDMAA